MGTRKTLFNLPVICTAGKWSSLHHCSQSPESATMTEYWLPQGLRAGVSKLRKASSFSFWKVSRDSTPYTVTYLGSILLTNRDSSFAVSGICGHVNIGSKSFLLSFSVFILHPLTTPQWRYEWCSSCLTPSKTSFFPHTIVLKKKKINTYIRYQYCNQY